MREHQSRGRTLRYRAGICLALSVAALGTFASAAIGATANDRFFGLEWGDSNTGQAIPTQESKQVLGEPLAGTPGADDRALKAWGVTTGNPSVIIGEVDTGVAYTHPDLAANIWTNPGTFGGCLPGTHGYNGLEPGCNPMDKDVSYRGHGTHVAGIMGALGGDGIGVAGMNWHTTILPVKWRESANAGPGDLAAALKWLIQVRSEGLNIRVVNDSAVFESEEPSVAKEVRTAIAELGAEGVLFVTAAGNGSQNNDLQMARHTPCSFGLANEICVTATDNNDSLPSWANWGPNTVDLGAPGVSILSTLREPGPGFTTEPYGYLSGGSMAAAQVSGAAALILSVAPGLTVEQLKADILNNVHPVPSLAGKVKTGGRLDVCKALPGCEPVPVPPPPPPAPPPPPPPPPPTVQPSSIALTSTVLRVSHNKTKVGLRCMGATACTSKLALTVKVRTRVGHGTRTSFRTKVRTIGTARFAVGPEGVVQVTINLNDWGRRLVRVGNGRLNASLTVFASTPAPAATQTHRIRLTWPPKRHR
jgi:hypothetical protein